MSLSELAVPDEWLPPSSSESVKRRIPSSGSLLRRRHLLNLKVRAFCIDVAVRLRSSVNSPLRLKGLCLSLIFRSSCRVVPTSCSSRRRAVSSSQCGLKNEGSSRRCSLPITSIRSLPSRPLGLYRKSQQQYETHPPVVRTSGKNTSKGTAYTTRWYLTSMA